MPKQARAVRTREALISSAAEAFVAGGFAHSSLAEISARAGVSSGALHFHFRSKGELGAAVESAAAQTLRGLLETRPVGQPDSLQRLVDVLQLLAERLADDVVLQAGFDLISDASWPGGEGLGLWRVWRDWVETTLSVARREGRLAGDVALDDVVRAATATVVGVQVLRRIEPDWCNHQVVGFFWKLAMPRLSAAPVRDETVAPKREPDLRHGRVGSLRDCTHE